MEGGRNGLREAEKAVKAMYSDIMSDITRECGRNARYGSQSDRQPDFLDQAAIHRDNDVTFRLFKRKSEHLDKVWAALRRIEDGSYGLCSECGEEIGVARLIANPITTLCLECQRIQERCARIRSPQYRTASSLPAS